MQKLKKMREHLKNIYFILFVNSFDFVQASLPDLFGQDFRYE